MDADLLSKNAPPGFRPVSRRRVAALSACIALLLASWAYGVFAGPGGFVLASPLASFMIDPDGSIQVTDQILSDPDQWTGSVQLLCAYDQSAPPAADRGLLRLIRLGARAPATETRIGAALDIRDPRSGKPVAPATLDAVREAVAVYFENNRIGLNGAWIGGQNRSALIRPLPTIDLAEAVRLTPSVTVAPLSTPPPTNLVATRTLWLGVAALGVQFVMPPIVIVLLIPIIPWLWRSLKRPDIEMFYRCPVCNYSLRGLKSSVCPECGGAVRQPGSRQTPPAAASEDASAPNV